MDNKLVSRMNKVGKVGKIITIVIIVIAILSAIGTLVGAITATAIPQNTVEARVSAQADVTLNKDVFGDLNNVITTGINDHIGTIDHVLGGSVNIKAENADGDALLHVDANDLNVQSGSFAPMIWVGFANIVAFIVCGFFFKSLMGELEISASPFTEGVVFKMRRFAICLLAVSIATSVINAIFSMILMGGHGFSFHFNLGSIITAVIIFVLAMVFRYGAQLQKESDETL